MDPKKPRADWTISTARPTSVPSCAAGGVRRAAPVDSEDVGEVGETGDVGEASEAEAEAVGEMGDETDASALGLGGATDTEGDTTAGAGGDLKGNCATVAAPIFNGGGGEEETSSGSLWNGAMGELAGVGWHERCASFSSSTSS